jgi:hypothetical protein
MQSLFNSSIGQFAMLAAGDLFGEFALVGWVYVDATAAGMADSPA